MTTLLQFNAFGLVSITRDRITASATVVAGERSSTRSIIQDLEQPLADVLPGEAVAVTFGAWIEKGKKSKVTVHEMGSLKSGVLFGQIPEVRSAIGKVLEMVGNSASVD